MSSDRYLAKPILNIILEEQGRRQTWIAERLGVSKFVAHRICNGITMASEDQARQIAALVQVPFFVLFDTANAVKSPDIAAVDEVPA